MFKNRMLVHVHVLHCIHSEYCISLIEMLCSAVQCIRDSVVCVLRLHGISLASSATLCNYILYAVKKARVFIYIFYVFVYVKCDIFYARPVYPYFELVVDSTRMCIVCCVLCSVFCAASNFEEPVTISKTNARVRFASLLLLLLLCLTILENLLNSVYCISKKVERIVRMVCE